MKSPDSPAFFGLKLSHKGLMLVGVLFLLELLFVGCLWVMQEQTEQIARREAHSKEIVGQTQQLIKSLVDASNDLVAFGHSGEDADKEQFFKSVGLVAPCMSKLENAVRDEPEQYKLVEKMKEKIEKGIAHMVESVNRYVADPEGVGLPSIRQARDEIQPLINESIPLVVELATMQKRIIEETPEKQEKSRQLNKKLLLIGLVVNLLFAVALAIFFTRAITGRLDLLVDNTARLKEGEKLNPVMKGSDEIVQLDEAFHNMADALAAAEKRKQELVQMVSHDLRTPLSSVQTYLELLGMGALGEISEKAQERNDKAEVNIERLIKLIDDMLDIEKMKDGKIRIEPALISLCELLEASADSVSGYAGRQKVTVRVKESELEIYADRARLIQVMVNLLSNAVKYSPEGGTVSIDVDESDELVTIKVTDQGPGVPEDYKASIFERFEMVEGSAAHKKKGTGLGLAISKVIVEQHGGTIGVESVEGEGSTFWVKLPLNRPETS